MALAARLDKRDYHTWVLIGDGESAEGSIWEAAGTASYYKLNNLTVIADINRLGQSQPTMLQYDLDTYKKRFAAFGWSVLVIDGHDMAQIVSALRKARRSKDQPTAILAKTIKGKGISFAEDKEGWHGRAFKKGEEHDKAIAELQAQLTGATGAKVKRVPREKPVEAHKPVPIDPPAYKLGEMVATREAYGTALVKIGAVDPRVVALDGDTKNSTFADKFFKAYPERSFEGFIAEQNMVTVAAGLASRGKVPFASTFACFMERATDQVRMATISFANIKLVGSHAGVSIGEDGPSQMALEDIAIFRAMADCVVLYPCDAVSTERAVELAANHTGMVFIRTSRPKTPVIYENHHEFSLGKANLLRHSDHDKVTVVGAGVTVFEALKAYDQLKAQGTLHSRHRHLQRQADRQAVAHRVGEADQQHDHHRRRPPHRGRTGRRGGGGCFAGRHPRPQARRARSAALRQARRTDAPLRHQRRADRRESVRAVGRLTQSRHVADVSCADGHSCPMPSGIATRMSLPRPGRSGKGEFC